MTQHHSYGNDEPMLQNAGFPRYDVNATAPSSTVLQGLPDTVRRFQDGHTNRRFHARALIVQP